MDDEPTGPIMVGSGRIKSPPECQRGTAMEGGVNSRFDHCRRHFLFNSVSTLFHLLFMNGTINFSKENRYYIWRI